MHPLRDWSGKGWCQFVARGIAPSGFRPGSRPRRRGPARIGGILLPGWIEVSSLPPLECLRFFEAAARHQSFTGAALELGCTRAVVSYRVRTLEAYLELALFDRRPRGIRLNRHGRAYLHEVGPRLAELGDTTDRHRIGRGGA